MIWTEFNIHAMISGRNRFIVLFFLALLQCFAPLLHAHAHGISVEGKVHMHGEGKANTHVHASPVHEQSGLPSFTADRDEAPVIAMAQEFRHEIVIALSDAPQPAVTISPLELSPARPCRAEEGCFLPSRGHCAYLFPFSQAPPSALI